MNHILGIGEYGSCELFGSTTICVMHIPLTIAPTLTAKFLGYLSHTANDYDAFRIIKEIFPNYNSLSVSIPDWLSESHYYNVPVENDTIPEGVINFMTDDPTFEVMDVNHIIACVYTIDVEKLNSMMDEYKSLGGIMYSIISNAISRLEEELQNIMESSSQTYDGIISRDDCDPSQQFVADWLSNMIARAGYLSQVQQLELQCKASLPRGVSKEANDFYLGRCVHMTPEDKRKLFKTFLMKGV